MSFYSEEIIEEVRSRNDIVDVVGSYVQLKHTGSRYFGLCPFHNEKTGSFSVNRNLQIFKCFGCGKGGNVISFVMQYENFSFPEAVKFLADRVGMQLPEAEPSEEEKLRRSEREKLLQINKDAATFFYYLLRDNQGANALKYLMERGLSEDTIKRFGLGYAGKYSDGLYKYLKQKEYKDDFIKQSGLVSIDERGGYDKFWNRVIFPIMDINGKVIAFGGRIMGDPGKSPKYLNSPETKVFDKGRNLYALNIVRKSKRDYILLCEGYMDVIALHQAGFDNAVASLGTALTEMQAKLISRYVKNVVITYDSDEAGQRAALRAIPILRGAGLAVKVLDMKPYKDPDEFIKAFGADEYQKRIDNALNSFFYEIDRLRDGHNLDDPDEKASFEHAIANKLSRIEDEIARDSYLEAVSKRYSIKPELLHKQANRIGYDAIVAENMRERKEQERREQMNSKETVESTGRKHKRDDRLRQSEKILLTYLATDTTLFERIKGIISPQSFLDETNELVAQMVFEQYEKEGKVSPARILSRFEDSDEQAYVAGLFTAEVKGQEDETISRKAFADIVMRVRESELKAAYSQAIAANDANRMTSIMKLQQELPHLRGKLM